MRKCFVILLLLATVCGVSNADTLNFDPNLVPPAPVLDQGWAYDMISAAYTDSADSPYVYNLSTSAIFRITDYFVTGDKFFVYDFGTLILSTSLNGAQATIPPIGQPGGNLGWASAMYEHGQVVLSAGAHSLTVQGNGGGGVPAGFYTRLDSMQEVPTPSSLVALFGMAAVGFVVVGKRLRD